MLRMLRARLKQGFRTVAFPGKPPALPPGYVGRPRWERGRCAGDCTACIEACPTGAIARTGDALTIDTGRCLFCTDCTDTCPTKAIQFTAEYRMAARTREALVVDDRPHVLAQARMGGRGEACLAPTIFGRSLKLRQVSAGGCNACEADTNVLNTIVYDLGRFGIQFVASPRHADGLLITGPVTRNMELALKKTYEATPSPRIVVAVGACAISGGVFAGHPDAAANHDSPVPHKGADEIIPVDLYVPGCPPHPATILDGLLRLLGRLRD